jgi:putative endonuclease
MNDYYVYILTNEHGNVMYVGVTSNLEKRIAEHKAGTMKGFTSKYNIHKLVYFEQTSSIESAIMREKEIKKWRREKKNKLVETLNPDWNDLKDWGDFSATRSK